MPRQPVVRRRVPIGRAVAAAHFSAGETDPQMQPLAAGSEAVLASVDRIGRLPQLDLTEVCTDAEVSGVCLVVFRLDECHGACSAPGTHDRPPCSVLAKRIAADELARARGYPWSSRERRRRAAVKWRARK